MRGGLGRILLTAFMLLAIVPVGVLSYLATRRVQIDTRQEAVANLDGVVQAKASLLDTWLGGYDRNLSLLAQDTALRVAVEESRWNDACAILQERSLFWGDWSVELSVPVARTGQSETFVSCVPDQETPVCSSIGAAGLAGKQVFSSLRLHAPVLASGAGHASPARTAGCLIAYPLSAALERLMQVEEDGHDLHVYLFAPSPLPAERASSAANAKRFADLETSGAGSAQALVETCPVATVPPFVYEFCESKAFRSSGLLLRKQSAFVAAGTTPERESISAQASGLQQGSLSGAGFYEDGTGRPIVGGYRWLEGWQVGLWAEQPRQAVEAREDELAAVLIGSTLGVALLTAVLAAVVTRQVTQPIVQLTMSAVKIAAGDLSQKVELERRDEIGVLARAFNVMTAELRSLYDGLEGKVAERTQQLTRANRELRYKAMQLKLSAEVGRIATSILDLDLLQQRVTELVLEAYAHAYGVDYVAIWICDEFGESLERQAFSGAEKAGAALRIVVGEEHTSDRAAWAHVQAMTDGQVCILNLEEADQRQICERKPFAVCESKRSQCRAQVGRECVPYVLLVVPLRIGTRAIGSLEIHCLQKAQASAICERKPFAVGDAIGEDELEMLQGLGNQISVAVENARLYALEHKAVERLSRLDHLRLASLGVGSRELATELNTIIGFSRLILKGIDGPLTDLQQADLSAIYKSGYRLLGLIDNVITLSELESGQVELVRHAVDWETLWDEVGITAEQRLVDVRLLRTSQEPLPPIEGDAALLRRAIMDLAAAVAEQSELGSVTMAVTAGRAAFSRSSLEGDGTLDAVLIAAADCEASARQMCEMAAAGAGRGQRGVEIGQVLQSALPCVDQISVGLALARRIVVLHGGEMWLDFDAGGGMSGLVALPLTVDCNCERQAFCSKGLGKPTMDKETYL